jgi:hypothetical protein
MQEHWIAKLEPALRQIASRSSGTAGCSDGELAAFQRDRRLELPEAYLHYLRAVGVNPGEFMRGSDLKFEELDALQSEAPLLLEEENGPSLPENAFVFIAHQGYQFLFFRLDEGADPPIYHYLEGESDFKVVAPSFSDWLVGAVRDEFSDAGGSSNH